MIMNFLSKRSQYTQVNSHNSPIIQNKPIGCYQGSVFSSLLFLIYTLDIVFVNHNISHKNHINYNRCNNPNIQSYVDDSFGIIVDTDINILRSINKYIININNYYTNNKLLNNVSKSNIMFITKNNNLKKLNISINNINFKHTNNIKILGTTINDNLDWSSHLENGKDSLFKNLKLRKNMIYHLARKVSKTFAKQYANAIYKSKLHYHLEIWGSCSRTQKTFINNQMIAIAIHVSNLKTGLTNEHYLSDLKMDKF